MSDKQQTPARVLQNRIQGFGSTNASEADHGSSSSRGRSSYSGGFSSSNDNNHNSSSNGAGGSMVGFGNPRFDSSTSNKASGNSSVNKWLPASVANKLDNLSMLPKDRAGGLRFQVASSSLCLAALCLACFCLASVTWRHACTYESGSLVLLCNGIGVSHTILC